MLEILATEFDLLFFPILPLYNQCLLGYNIFFIVFFDFFLQFETVLFFDIYDTF
jgi:hypothetical protein